MTFTPDKNFWCRCCGEPEKDTPNHKHHIIPRSIGGQDIDGRIILCKKCHDIMHNTYPAVLWDFVVDKENARIALKQYVKSRCKYNDYPKTIN